MVYSISAGVDLSYGANGRILVRTPAEDFVIVDRSGLVTSFLKDLQTGGDGATTFLMMPEDIRHDARERVLTMLRARRVVVEGAALNFVEADPLTAWLRHVAIDPAARNACVVSGTGMLREMVEQYLQEAGVATRSDAGDAFTDDELVVGCWDNADEGGARALNRRSVADGATLLLLTIDRSIGTVGPLVIPDATACYECCFQRVRAGRKNLEAEHCSPASGLPSRVVARLTAAHATAFVLRYLGGAAFDLHVASITRHDVLTGRSGHTVALKVPRCPVCGQANMRKPPLPNHAAPAIAEQAA
jgi:bacteriocin biosynthesis cyclodehydratase domain-containing protein